VTDAFVGDLTDWAGHPITLGDLWGLRTGLGGSGGTSNQLFFTAGLMDESHGLFGTIAQIPEASTWIMLTLGLGLIGASLRAGRSKRAVPAAA